MGPVKADDLDIKWTHPTQRIGGTVLALNEIANTELEYAPCAGALLGVPVTTVSVPAPATSKLIQGLAEGSWCVRARTVDTQGLASDWTGVVARKSRPAPPVITSVLRVAANGTYTTRPVYALDPLGKLISVSSRRVAVGEECDPSAKQGTNYYSVAGKANALKPTEPLPDGSFAYCAQSNS